MKIVIYISKNVLNVWSLGENVMSVVERGPEIGNWILVLEHQNWCLVSYGIDPCVVAFQSGGLIIYELRSYYLHYMCESVVVLEFKGSRWIKTKDMFPKTL